MALMHNVAMSVTSEDPHLHGAPLVLSDRSVGVASSNAADHAPPADESHLECARTLSSLYAAAHSGPLQPVQADSGVPQRARQATLPSIAELIVSVDRGHGYQAAPAQYSAPGRRQSCESTASLASQVSRTSWTSHISTPSTSEYASSRASSIALWSPAAPVASHDPQPPPYYQPYQPYQPDQPYANNLVYGGVHYAHMTSGLAYREEERVVVEEEEHSPYSHPHFWRTIAPAGAASDGRAARRERQPSRSKVPHCNKKYPAVCRNYILYMRTTKSVSWNELADSYNRERRRLARYTETPHKPDVERTVSGLQAVYYRARLEMPILDADGNLVFHPASRGGGQVFGKHKVRRHRDRKRTTEEKLDDMPVDLVTRFPEDVACHEYYFVDRADISLAKEMAAKYDRQRKQQQEQQEQQEQEQQTPAAEKKGRKRSGRAARSKSSAARLNVDGSSPPAQP